MKQLLSEKRTQVYFPMNDYRRIEKRAKEESKSSAAIIREAVEKYLSS
jgi:predicted DNA-binding protein